LVFLSSSATVVTGGTSKLIVGGKNIYQTEKEYFRAILFFALSENMDFSVFLNLFSGIINSPLLVFILKQPLDSLQQWTAYNQPATRNIASFLHENFMISHLKF